MLMFLRGLEKGDCIPLAGWLKISDWRRPESRRNMHGSLAFVLLKEKIMVKADVDEAAWVICSVSW